ncbi:MAG: RnfABCDGE type electron transport complex subunit D [Spirochaetaceae bacterium]|nr:RnfABCDGE type electron transport complex subunit D [Spirochaetaceae bacterium]
MKIKKKYSKLRLSPFCHIVPSVGSASLGFILVLLPQILMLVLGKHYDSLILMAVSVAACCAADFVANKMCGKKIFFDFNLIIEGLIVGMFIPQSYSPVLLFFIVFVGMLVCKYAFGGFASGWVNPCAVVVIIAYFMGKRYFPGFLVDLSMLQTSNPAGALFSAGVIQPVASDFSITAGFNSFLSRYLGIVLPEGYVTLFLNTQSVIPALRYNFLTLLASFVLILLDMVDWIIPFCFLAVYAVLARCFALIPAGVLLNGDILLALLTSGTLFAAFFLMPYYGTVPASILGKFVYGIIGGLAAFVICGCGTSHIGIVFTVIVTNLFSPVIQYLEEKCFSIFRIPKIKLRAENER